MGYAEPNFARYCGKRKDMLTADWEAELALRVEIDGDEAARNELVSSHLPLIRRLARKYAGYCTPGSGIEEQDLAQEGSLGCMKACRKFSAVRGHRFSAYARWWIEAEIVAYVCAKSGLVRIRQTDGHKKVFFRLSAIRNALVEANPALTEADLRTLAAEQLDVDEEVIEEVVVLRRSALSLSAPIGNDDTTLEHVIAGDGPSPEETAVESERHVLAAAYLREGLDALSERERVIVRARRLREEPLNLEELATELGISRERVRQIEVAAVAKLKTAVLRQVGRRAISQLMAA